MNRIKDFFKGFAKELSDKDLASYAASIAFFLFLSLLPILILLSLFLPLTGYGVDDLISMVTAITPDLIDELIAQIIREVYARSAGLVSITLIFVIWTAAQCISALIRGLRIVYEVPGKKNYFTLNLIAIITMFAVTGFLILTLIALVLIDTAIQTVDVNQFFLPALTPLILHFHRLFMLPLAVVLLTLLYTFISGAEKRLRSHLAGAVVSAVAISLFTWIFSAYVRYNRSYRSIYGSLTTFVVMLFWGYACIYLLLIGGCLNHYLMKRKSGSSDEKASPDQLS